jgi:hypothetical protein
MADFGVRRVGAKDEVGGHREWCLSLDKVPLSHP